MATRANARQTARMTFFGLLGLMLAAALLLVSAVVPRLESPRVKANRRANLQLEEARRILATYDTGLSIDNDYRSVLGDEWFTLSADAVNELLADPDYDIQGDANAELSDYVNRQVIKSLPALEQQLLTLLHGQQHWSAHKEPPPPSRMSGAGMVTRGTAEYERLLQQNARVLDQALAAANQALQITVGDYSTRQHPAGNRLIGAISYQQGLELAHKVALLREDLAQRRFAMKQDAGELALVEQKLDVVPASDIDTAIERARDEHRAALANVVDQQAKVEVLSQNVIELEGRVQSAVAAGDAAREAMEALQDVGVDLSNPSGFGAFQAAFTEQARRYREALFEAGRLKRGTLSNATIDYTGDYIHGQYVPVDRNREIGIERGLIHLKQDLETAQAELERMAETAARLEENVEAMLALKLNFEQRARLAEESARALRQRLDGGLSEYLALMESLRDVEEQAISRFEKATSSFRAALNGVSAEEREAQDSPTKPSDPSRAAYHYSQVAGRQQELKGQLEAEQADANLRSGLVYLGRYQDATDSLADLGSLAGLEDAQRAEWEELAEQARQSTIEVTDQAITLLRDQAQNKLKDSGWLVAAEIAVAHYVQAMVGVEFAGQKALGWYRAAVDGRDGVPEEHRKMWEYLQTRLRRPAP